MQPFRKFTNAGAGVTGLLTASGGTAIADNKVIRGDGTTGIQGSTATLSDAGLLTVTGGIEFDGGGGPQIQRSGSTVSIGVNSPPLVGGDGSSTNGLFMGNSGKVQWASGNPSTTGDIGLERVVAGVGKVTDGSTGYGFLQTAGFKRKAADQTVTNSITYVNDSDLVETLVAGRTYKFRYHIFGTTVSTSGMNVRLGGTATHTDLISDIRIFSPVDLIYTHAIRTDDTTANNHVIGISGSIDTVLSPIITIEGTTTINAGGTFLVQFAQNAETGAAETASFLRGSTLQIWNMV